MSVKSPRRLEFEDALLAQVTAPRRKQSRQRMPSVLWMFLVCNLLVWMAALVLAAGPGGGIGLPFWGMSSRIAHTAATFVEALQHGDLSTALEMATVAGTRGKESVRSENERTYLPEIPATDTDMLDTDGELRQTVHDMYADLSRQGLDWSRARAFAFVGVTAKAKHPDRMKRSIRLATGEIYVASGDTVYAIEVSVRCPGKECYISDIWSWRRMGGLPTDVKGFLRSQKASYEQDLPENDLGVKLSWVRRIMVML